MFQKDNGFQEVELRTGGLRLQYKLYVNPVAVQLILEDSTDFLDRICTTTAVDVALA
jgi:hypothetical protein